MARWKATPKCEFIHFEETIKFLHAGRNEYRAKFTSLVEFCNWLTRYMPLKLMDALEDMHKDNNYSSVVCFVLFCKGMMERFKEELQEIKERKPTIWFILYFSFFLKNLVLYKVFHSPVLLYFCIWYMNKSELGFLEPIFGPFLLSVFMIFLNAC